MADNENNYTVQDLQDNLDYLQETKTQIKNAIVAKGQTIESSDTFRSYASKIAAIETGVDTSDATATANDILSPKTAYVNGAKITGAITGDYTTNGVSKLTYSSLYASTNMYNFAVSEDGNYMADVQSSTLKIFRRNNASAVTLITSTNENLPTIKNIDVKFSPIIENNKLRLAVTGGIYISIFEFDTTNNTLTFLLKFSISNYTSNSIYSICWANMTKDIITVLSTNLDSWGYNPVASTFRIIENNGTYSATNLWNKSVSRWQAGHFCTWNTNDTAFCYSCIHTRGAGYLLVNSDYTFISQYNEADTVCYLLEDKVKRVAGKNFQTYANNTWTTKFSYSTPSDPDYCFFNRTGDLFFVGNVDSNKLYVYTVNWYTNTCTLTYNLDLPTYHMYFGSNNDDEVCAILGVNKERSIIYCRNSVTTSATVQLFEQSLEYTSITINNRQFLYLDDTTATRNDVVSGKTYYNRGGKTTGTMVNNGVLTYTPSSSIQTIPAGYTSGGTISAVDITKLSDYQTCDAIADSILEGLPLYTELEYIQSTGTQFVDTKFVPDNDTKYEIVLSNVNISGEYVIFGTKVYNSNQDLLVVQSGNIRWYYPAGSFYHITDNPTAKCTITCYRGTTTYNGNILSTSTAIHSDVNTTNLYLLRCEQVTGFASCRIYSFKVYKNNTLVRDFIPVKDLANVVCLYDLVTNEFYYNSGTGTFVAGPEKEEV